MTDVRRPVRSVSKANDRGQTVWFAPHSAGIADAKNVIIKVRGEYLPLVRKQGVFELQADPVEPVLAALEHEEPAGAEAVKNKHLPTPPTVSKEEREQH